jgi:hypothetical protein
MRLIDVVESLESISRDGTIYAVGPWSWDSDAVVAREQDDGGIPAVAASQGMQYFLEVFIAKEVLEDSQLSTRENCDRLIEYATNDA